MLTYTDFSPLPPLILNVLRQISECLSENFIGGKNYLHSVHYQQKRINVVYAPPYYPTSMGKKIKLDFVGQKQFTYKRRNFLGLGIGI